MCGIFGFSSSKINEGSLSLLRKSRDTLMHRGPDAAGEYCDQHAYLGHRRLSIIDLSVSANQPMKAANVPVFIIFNGEIYNYKQLSEDLGSLKTKSDTEVILQGYIQKGVDFFKLLRGIYAFCIYDCRTEPKLILYRDLAGVKPLYVYHSKDNFTFASEIKAIKTLHGNLPVNDRMIKSYLSLGYCLEPETIYKNLIALRPGECMTYKPLTDTLESIILNAYNFSNQNTKTFSENKSETLNYLTQAVHRNKVADVPVRFSLSGGIDSSLIYAMGVDESPVKAITIKFTEKMYDESAIAMEYGKALNRPVEVVTADAHSDLDLLNKILLHFDQPYADSSAIPFYILSHTSSHSSKVLIGGDGGDEIQGGYPSYGILPWMMKLKRYALAFRYGSSLAAVFSKEKSRQLKRLYELMLLDSIDDIMCEWQAWIPPSTKFNGKSVFKFDVNDLFSSFNIDSNDLSEITVEERITKDYFYKRMLSDYLRKTDMMSMLNSIEYRVPMLDEDLVSFSLTIPYAQKSGLFNYKKILRGIHSELYPPQTSALKKKGFGIPLDQWLNDSDFEKIKKIVLDKEGIVHQYIEEDYVYFLFSSLNNKSTRASISRSSVYQRILILYALQIWYFKNN